MSKPSERKSRKQRDRKIRLAAEVAELKRQSEAQAVELKRRLAKQAAEQRYRDEFPQFVASAGHDSSKPSNVPEDLIQRVQDTAASLRLDDLTVFTADQIRGFRLLREYGALVEAESQYQLFRKLCDVVLKRATLASPSFPDFFPFNLFQLSLYGAGNFTALFKGLEVAKSKTGHGLIYYSSLKPTVVVDGVERSIGWRKHAIDQLRRRLLYRKDDWEQASEAFWYLHSLMHFEVCHLTDGQRAFSFFNNCVPMLASGQIAKAILGERPTTGNWFYRLGYAPADVDGEFLVARTVLFPGFSKTPEYAAISRSSLPSIEKEQLRKAARDLSFVSLMTNNNLDVLRWFHTNGVPQVIEGETSWLGDHW